MAKEHTDLARWVATKGTVERPAIYGFVCEDWGLYSFACGCYWHGFNLPQFDNWLADLGECEAQREMFERRQSAWDAIRDNNDDAAKRHLEWMMLRRHAIEREEFLLPLARRGSAHKKASESQRHVEIDEWIAEKLSRDPNAKSPALWNARPDFIRNPRDHEPIGDRAFAARVTGVRKGRRGKTRGSN